MSLNEKIKKLLDSDVIEDRVLGIYLLEGDSISFEDKKEFIEYFLKQNPDSFTKEQKMVLEAWLELSRKNAENLIKNRIKKY